MRILIAASKSVIDIPLAARRVASCIARSNFRNLMAYANTLSSLESLTNVVGREEGGQVVEATSGNEDTLHLSLCRAKDDPSKVYASLRGKLALSDDQSLQLVARSASYSQDRIHRMEIARSIARAFDKEIGKQVAHYVARQHSVLCSEINKRQTVAAHLSRWIKANTLTRK